MKADNGSWKKLVGLLLLVIFVYLANGRTLGSGDTVPARYLPLSLLHEFDFDLDEFGFLYEDALQYYLQYRNGHIISTFPPGPPLMALPVYFLPVMAGMSAHSPWLPFLEKLSATFIAMLSVLFLYLTLKQLTSEKVALVIALIYALGTSTFSVSGQALWQHGPAQFLLTLTLYLLVRGLRQRQYVGIAGLPLMGMVVCRPTDVLIALPIVVYVVHQRSQEFLRFAVFSLPPVLSLLAYNSYYFGSFSATGYGPSLADPTSFWWKGALVDGLLWILVSPHRGLFIYSPILVMSIVGIVRVWQQWHRLLQYLSIAPLLVILCYAKLNWAGGWSYGPRYMADIAPLLCLYLFPVFETAQRRPLLKCLIAPLVIVSIAMHTVGAFGYDGSWEGTVVDRADMDRFWSWSGSPFLHYGKRVVRAAIQQFSTVRHTTSASRESNPAPTYPSTAQLVSNPPEGILAAVGPGCPLAALLDWLSAPLDKPPTLTIATDKAVYRSGEVSTMMVSVLNVELPRTLVAYFALERPDGTVWFLGGTGLSGGDLCDGTWIHYGLSYPFWKGHGLEDYPLVGLWTQRMAPGMYVWHFFFTEPRSYHVVAKAMTTFIIQP